MKKYFIALSLVIGSLSVLAESFDYTQIKPEHYKKLEHRSEFTDKQGFHFRIENTDSIKGLYVQEVENGKLKWKKHGVFYKYYKGRLTELVTYSYGKKDGLRESYNNKTIVTYRDNYQSGQKHGVSQQFNDKGDKVDESTYINGRRQGKRYSYNNKKKHFESDYVDGKRHGEVLQYNLNGKIVARTKYSNDKQVGKTQSY